MEHMKKIKNKILKYVLIIIFFSIIIWLEFQIYDEKRILKNQISGKEETKTMIQIQNKTKDKAEENINEQNENISNENTSIVENKTESEESNNLPEQYYGYKICAKLEIPTINLETYVLETYSTQSLKVSVTKFWGANANEIGNFCIAGHNFKNSNMFHNLKKIKVGDKIYITDKQNKKIEYIVYDVYQVLPEEVECVSQKTNGKREVTLITCTYNSKKRIIIKASE